MPDFSKSTPQGTITLRNASREPTEAEWAEIIMRQTAAAATNAPETAGIEARGSGTGPVTPSGSYLNMGGVNATLPSPKRFDSRAASVGADLALEAGVPMAAQTLTAPLGPVVQAFAGAATSALGNALGQLKRQALGEQEGWEPGQFNSAMMTGAIPFAGPAANAAKVSARPLLRKIGAAAVGGGRVAGVNVLSEANRVAVDENRPLTAKEIALAGSLGLVLGSAGEAMSRSAGEKIQTADMLKRAMVAQEAAEGRYLTPGALLPEDFANVEQRLAAKNPDAPVGQNVTKMVGQFREGVQDVAPNAPEPKVVLEQTRPLLHQVENSKASLEKLSKLAQDSQRAAEEARLAVEVARKSTDETAAKLAAREASRLSDAAFNDTFNSIAANAKQIALEQVSGGLAGINPAVTRAMVLDHVIKPAKDAMALHTEALYSQVPRLTEAFDTSQILSKLDDIAVEVSGGKPGQLSSGIKTVRKLLSDVDPDDPEKFVPREKVSWRVLQIARDEMLNAANRSTSVSKTEETFLRKGAHEISKQINEQADVLGKEAGDALRKANAFYTKLKPLETSRGVEAFLTGDPGDTAVQTLVGSMYKSGINSEEYQNVQRYLDLLGTIRPEIRDVGKAELNKLVKQSILQEFVERAPASLGGELRVSPGIVDRLVQLDKAAPGTLETLGLGGPKMVAQLKDLFAKYPAAGKLSTGEWEQIFSSGAFRHASQGGELLAQPIDKSLEPVKSILAAKDAQNRMVLAASLKLGGRVEKAERVRTEALTKLREAGGNLTAARDLHDKLLQDPVALAWNNPDISAANFSVLSNALFDAGSGVLKNTDIREMVTSLRNSKDPKHRELLKDYQRRYIADRLAANSRSRTYTTLPDEPDAEKFSRFFNPVNPTDGKNEILRAAEWLEPEQFEKLKGLSKMADVLNRYDMYGAVTHPTPRIPTSYQTRLGLDVVTDLVEEGRYHTAALLLAEPQAHEIGLRLVGTNMGLISLLGKEGAAAALARNPALRIEVAEEEDRQRRANEAAKREQAEKAEKAARQKRQVQFEPGKRYRDAQGNLATYNGTEFTPIT